MSRKKVFISDLGGGGWTPAYHIDQSRWIVAHLPISRYAARALPGRNKRHVVIYGGVDLDEYQMRERLEHDGSVVFLGRILPHKGIHYLIQGLPNNVSLKLIGVVGDQKYYKHLLEISHGKKVEFLHELNDLQVQTTLRRAMAIVHPTPVDAHGNARANELFGLAVVEAMALGCVPIVSRAASLPELLDEGQSGFLVPPNNSRAIGDAIERLKEDIKLWSRMSTGARQHVEAKFGWQNVVVRCLDAYGLN